MIGPHEWDENSLVIDGVQVVDQRMKQYGPPSENWDDIARGWSVLFGVEVTSKQAVLAMIWLKMCRELYKHSDDNIRDIGGYDRVLEIIKKEKKKNVKRTR